MSVEFDEDDQLAGPSDVSMSASDEPNALADAEDVTDDLAQPPDSVGEDDTDADEQ